MEFLCNTIFLEAVVSGLELFKAINQNGRLQLDKNGINRKIRGIYFFGGVASCKLAGPGATGQLIDCVL